MSEPMSAAYGFALFCEDVRNEVGGTQSYIGVNPGSMSASGYPIQIPKMAIVCTFVQDAREEMDGIEFVVFFDAEGQEPTEMVRVPVEPPTDRTPGTVPGRVTKIAAQLMLSPVVIGTPGILRARAYRRGEEFKLGALTFVQDPGQPVEVPIAS